MRFFFLIQNLYHYRRYIFFNAWNELHLRYAGTGIGIFWNVIHPLCEIIIYTIVFSLLLSRGTTGHSYALYLTTALLPWRTFADAIAQGANAFTQNAVYLKRLAIPPEIFVGKSSVIALLLLLIYLVLLLPLSLMFGGQLGFGVLLLPIFAILLHSLGFGIALALASLQILFPDIRQVLQFVIPLWSWTMPIFYPDTIIPQAIHPLLYLNPPYVFIESIRYIFLENRIPNFTLWLIMIAWISVFLGLGAIVNDNLQDDVRDVV